MPLYKKAMAIRKKVFGPTHPAVAQTMSNIAVALWKQKEFGGAASMLQEASDILGGHPAMLAAIAQIKRHEPCTM